MNDLIIFTRILQQATRPIFELEWKNNLRFRVNNSRKEHFDLHIDGIERERDRLIFFRPLLLSPQPR